MAPTRISTSASSGSFILDSLAELNREHAIDAIVTIAHGSAGAFIGGDPSGDGLVAADPRL